MYFVMDEIITEKSPHEVYGNFDVARNIKLSTQKRHWPRSGQLMNPRERVWPFFVALNLLIRSRSEKRFDMTWPPNECNMTRGQIFTAGHKFCFLEPGIEWRKKKKLALISNMNAPAEWKRKKYSFLSLSLRGDSIDFSICPAWALRTPLGAISTRKSSGTTSVGSYI